MEDSYGVYFLNNEYDSSITNGVLDVTLTEQGTVMLEYYLQNVLR